MSRWPFYLLIPVVLYSIWWGSLRPLLASQAFVRKDAVKALSYNSFINHEARKFLAQEAASSQNVDLVKFSLKEMEKNVKERPLDVKSWILLTYLYNRVEGEVWREKTKKAADRALELAPNREDVKKLQEL